MRPPSATQRPEQHELASYRLVTLFGIDVRLHVSVLLIFALVVTSLGRGILPEWHPDWSATICWLAALLAGLLFFASLLAHEFSHALVARRRGIATRSITLFLFGGLAAIEEEPQNPVDELLIAGAGPLMSMALATTFAIIAVGLDPHTFTQSGTQIQPATLSFGGTLALWLASINLMLALFNMVPGFPMDGGRVFRALLWWRSGDKLAATQTAAKAGSAFGWLLILTGLVMTFRGQLADGLWLAFIGWFIDHLASSSLRQQTIESALAGLHVGELMRTRFDKVPEHTPLDEFLDDFLLRSSQITWPVASQAGDLGVLTLDDLPVSRDRMELRTMTVGQYMRRFDDNESLSPTTGAADALRIVAAHSHPQPIVENGKVVGLLQAADVLRWVSAQMQQATAGAHA